MQSISPYLRFIHTDINLSTDYAYLIPWRCIYDYELVFLFDGELAVKTKEEEYTLTSGDVHIMPPLVWHTRYAPVGCPLKLYSVHFDISYMGDEYDFSPINVYSDPLKQNPEVIETDRTLTDRPYYTLHNIELPKKLKVRDPLAFMEILNSAMDAFTQKRFGYELDLKIYMMQLLKSVLLDLHDHNYKKLYTRREKDLMECVEYIKSHYNQKIDLEWLAGEHGLSLNYFRRLFTESVGKSPSDFQTDLRIAHAIDYMRTGTYSIAQVATLVGYEDFHYFSRVFKKKKNCSPSKFFAVP